MNKKLTELYFPSKVNNAPLKRSMSGSEIEMFVLDNKGKIDNSESIIKKAKGLNLSIQDECAKSMIEVFCLPNIQVISSEHNLIGNLAQLSELADKNDMHLFPFGTYFGQNQPEFRKKKWYNIKSKILTPEKFVNAGKCCGYHHHYALPRGMFDPISKSLNYKLDSKIKRSLLDSYNVLNAIDPILTCFLQSSPITDGNYLAKDSRLLLYRGGSKLKYPQGTYSRRQLFGGLSPYKHTLNDLHSTLRRKYNKWSQLMVQADYSSEIKNYNILDFSWNPVKINNKGTLEYRGCDSNFTKLILAAGTMISNLLKKIQQDFLYVVPMDIDLKDAFKIEGNMLFIPPHTLVRNKLQKLSAYDGLANDDLYLYCKKFFGLLQKLTDDNHKKLLNPIKLILEERRTVSDKIILRLKNKGFSDTNIPEDVIRELAIFYSVKFKKDIYQSIDLLESMK